MTTDAMIDRNQQKAKVLAKGARRDPELYVSYPMIGRWKDGKNMCSELAGISGGRQDLGSERLGIGSDEERCYGKDWLQLRGHCLELDDWGE